MELALPHQEDTHLIINQIKDFNFTLLQNTLRNNKINASNQINNYDVMNQSQHALTKEHALCHFKTRNNLHSLYTLKFKTDKIHSNRLTSNSVKVSNTFFQNRQLLAQTKTTSYKQLTLLQEIDLK